MKQISWLRKFIQFACIMMAMVVVLPCAVFATEANDSNSPIDMSVQESITLRFVYKNVPISGAPYSIYQVAAADENLNLSYLNEFSRYSVSFENMTTDTMNALANTLAGYAARDKIQPISEGTTQNDGTLTFSGLHAGLYLITGKTFSFNGIQFTPQPFLVVLPYLDDNGDWVYNLISDVKFSALENPPKFESRQVEKIWLDNDGENRPHSIVVQLLCNGDIYDEQELNEQNGWSYSWDNLPGGNTWQLVEKEVPQDYFVLVEQDNTKYIVKNTVDGYIPSTSPSPSPIPNTPLPSASTPNTSEPPRIPQTGQLWWPVPLLIAFGIVAFMIGFVLWKKTDNV